MSAVELKQAGCRVTQPRTAVLDFLDAHHSPASAQEIAKALKPRVNLASVYRTLGLFERLGLVQAETRHGVACYYRSEQRHHHIVCERCGAIECVPCEHDFSNLKHFSHVSHQITLSGICRKCS